MNVKVSIRHSLKSLIASSHHSDERLWPTLKGKPSCIVIGETPSQLKHFTYRQTVQCYLLQHVYMHTLQHGNLSTPELGTINCCQLPTSDTKTLHHHFCRYTHTSIVHTHRGSCIVTCSRGRSLSPSAWSSGRGLMSVMDSILSWRIAWPHVATAKATSSLDDRSKEEKHSIDWQDWIGLALRDITNSKDCYTFIHTSTHVHHSIELHSVDWCDCTLLWQTLHGCTASTSNCC